MKKMILAALILGVTTAKAQKIGTEKVPGIVSRAFNHKYPAAKEPSWEIEKGSFEVNFKDNSKEKSVLIEPTGKIIEEETAIPSNELPQSIKNYIAKNYKGANIKEAAQIILQSGEMNYEAEVKGKDLIFSKEGVFLRAVKD
ncbi:MAG: PepSY-like domain-containing protein [Bacteroidetes bacterium]|nr:PepSY-like domain-containing protein [Bacteroidota bacterium]